MKYIISDLVKLNQPIEVDETVDFSSIASTHHDIRKISKVRITGTGQVAKDKAIFDLSIKCDVVLPCALTLDDVNYPLDINTKEIFCFAPDAKEEDFEDDVNIVKGPYIELAPVVWQNIILNIPLRVVSENAYERMPKEGDNWKLVENDKKDDNIDPRFAVLKDLLKK